MIPVEYNLQIVVIIPQGNVEFWIIVILEVIWNSVLGVVNHWIGVAVNFNDTLEVFWENRGKRTASLEFNLIQQLT